MDDFAQSREPDDLFSDEIELTQQQQQVTQSKRNTAPTKPHPHQRHGTSNANHNQRGGRRGGQNGSSTSARAEQQPIPTAPSPTAPTDTTPSTTTMTTTTTATDTTADTAAPIPAEDPRTPSVRGDRSATGPSKPPKKTEAELTELMASMQLKNAAKTEAHARAEKDVASFLHREQQAAAKRVEERKAIREQDLERAKNRERKIRAKGVREWDSEKVEEVPAEGRGRGGGGRGFVRGVNGGVRGEVRGGGLASSRFGGVEDGEELALGNSGTGGGGGGGRGGRGRGRGRGRGESDGARGNGGRSGRGGRGGYFNGAKAGDAPPSTSAAPLVGGDSDFPALPTPASKPNTAPASKVESKTKPSVTAATAAASSGGIVDSTWADEMATPIEKT